MFRKLSFGCGSIQKEGWYNLDQEDFGQQFIGSSDLFPDEHFDIIVSHCSLQMNEWHSINDVLKDLHRVLKPGGVLRISLPNILAGFRAYEEGNEAWFPNTGMNIDERFSGWLTWFSTTKTLLTPVALICKLLSVGFKEAGGCDYGQSYFNNLESIQIDDRKGEVFFVEAKK